MKRGKIANIIGPVNNPRHLFIRPNINYNAPKKKRNVFAQNFTMTNMKKAKISDTVYYEDIESEKTQCQAKYTQAIKVETEDEYWSHDQDADKVPIDRTRYVTTPSEDNESDDFDAWGDWTGKPYEKQPENEKEMSASESLCPKKPPPNKDDENDYFEKGVNSNTIAKTMKPEHQSEDYERAPKNAKSQHSSKSAERPNDSPIVMPTYLQPFRDEGTSPTIRPWVAKVAPPHQMCIIPRKFNNAIGAITEKATIGCDMPYSCITERIDVYYVKGHHLLRFSMHDLLFNGLGPVCEHNGNAQNTTDHRRFRYTEDLCALIRAQGEKREKYVGMAWHHFPAEQMLPSIKVAKPQILGGSVFRCLAEFECNCWNTCIGSKNQCTYTRSDCTNYCMTACWILAPIEA